jgi:transcriptional regulator with XRE-family HTH domain
MAKGLTIDGAGAALKRLREDAGLSLPEAADAFNTDKSLISRYENNKVAAPEAYLTALAARLKRSTSSVVLECLKERYPKLATSRVGGLLEKIIRQLG